MPILQNIQVAEQEAETLRLNAQKEVEELKEVARNEAEAEASQILAEANNTVKLNNQETLNLIEKLEKETFEYISKEQDFLIQKAKANQEVGVNYILKQVIEIWLYQWKKHKLLC